MRTTIRFEGTETNLYSACRIGIANCRANLAAFAAEDSTYTEVFLDAQLAAVAAAEALPNEQERSVWHSGLRPGLIESRKKITDKWQKMSLLIEKVWSGAELHAKLVAAGEQYYERATQDNWEVTKSLIDNTRAFLASDSAELIANGMLPGFPAAFDVLAAEFLSLNEEFVLKKRKAIKEAEKKEKANLALYNQLIMMLDMGKRIFINDPELYDLFSYQTILGDLRGFRASGLKGKVTNNISNKPVAGVTLSVRYEDMTGVTGADGKFEFALASGTYTVDAEAPGYAPLTLENRQVKPGVMSRLNFSLMPLAAATVQTPAPELELAANGHYKPENGVHSPENGIHTNGLAAA